MPDGKKPKTDEELKREIASMLNKWEQEGELYDDMAEWLIDYIRAADARKPGTS